MSTIQVECPTCDNGCDCTITTPGCGHYGCWGVAATSAAECSSYAAAKARTTERLDAARAYAARVGSTIDNYVLLRQR